MNDNDNTALRAFRLYGDDVLRCAYACTGSYCEAEDITQEVFLTLCESSPEFTHDYQIKAWLIKSTINRSRNYRKSFRFNRVLPLDEKLENELSCEFTPEENELREKLFRLPEKYSEVLYLFYYEGYRIREIAKITGKAENTVSTLLRRGRQKLKLELEKEGSYGREGS